MAGNGVNNVITDKAYVPIVQKSRMENFLTFIYDKKEHKFLGRTGKSWFEITIFYIIFYSCLAGFFAANLAIFLKTLDDNHPRFYGKGSIIGINPGLGYQPWIKSNAESTLIQFDQHDPKTYAKYVEVLQTIFDRYKNSSGLRDCHDDESNADKDAKSACIFHLETFEKEGCGEPDFGFADGKPCVMLTLNKLMGWEPVSYPAGSVPDALSPAVRNSYNGDVAIDCEGEYFADYENVGEIKYVPESGINKTFFPYSKILGTYHQPFMMIKFENLKPGILVEVECKAYAFNIIHDRANRLGMVHFEMFKLNVAPHDDSKTTNIEEKDEEGSTDDV